MADGTRSQVAMRELEDSIASRFEAISASFEGRMSAIDEKLDRRFTEIIDALRVLAKNRSLQGEASAPSSRGFDHQSTPILSTGGSPTHVATQFLDPQRIRSDDPIYRLKGLEQVGGIKEYYKAFDSFRVQIDLPEEFFISWFITGLRSDIRKALQGCRFTSVVQAYAMGKIYEIAHPREFAGSESISFVSSSRLSSQKSAHPFQSVAAQEICSSSSLAIPESASTSLDSSPIVAETSEEKEATTSPAIRKDFESAEPDFRRATIIGESSTCQIVENLESNALRGNLHSTEKNREAELRIVEVLAKSANRDEYQLETKEFENSVSCAHKLFDEMPRRSLEPVLEGKPTIGCIVDDSSFRESLVHLSMVDMFTFDPGGQITAAVKLLTLYLSRIESHVLVQYSTKLPAVDAPNMFEEMPDLKTIRSLLNVPRAEVGGRNNPEVLSIPKSFDHVGGLVKLVFDPGGQITKEVEILELNWGGKKRADHVNMIAGHQLMFLKIVMSRNDKSARAETDTAALRDEQFVFTIFDPGGAGGCFIVIYMLLNSSLASFGIISDIMGGKRQTECEDRGFALVQWDPRGCWFINEVLMHPRMYEDGCEWSNCSFREEFRNWNWNLQQLVIQGESVYWVKEIEKCADCGKLIRLQWDPGGVHPPLLSQVQFNLGGSEPN